MKEIYELSLNKIEANMLNHFKNIVKDKVISPTETQEFFNNFSEWILRKNGIDSSKYKINFIVDKPLDHYADVDRVGKTGFNVSVDRTWALATGAFSYAFTMLLGAHETQHIVQSIKQPSLEFDLAREKKAIAALADKYANRKNTKKLSKLVVRLAKSNEYLHPAEQDADEKAYDYVEQLMNRMIVLTRDEQLIEYFRLAIESVEEVRTSEERARKNVQREYGKDVKVAKRLGVIDFGFNV